MRTEPQTSTTCPLSASDIVNAVRDGQPIEELSALAPAFHSTAMVEELYGHILHLARENLRDGAALAAFTLKVAEDLDDARAKGLALRAAANIRYLEGQHEQAYQHYQQAVECFRLAFGGKGDDEETARTQSSAIQTLAYLARYEEAMEWGEEARRVFAARNDFVRLARLDGNLANLYFRLDRFEDALRSYELARDAFLVCGTPQDVAAVLSNLATCYISVGRFDDSLSTHRQAREHCASHGFSLLVAQADYNIAYLHFQRGDYREAMRLYATARKHSAATGDFYHATLCNLDQAEMMLDLNLLDEAERLSRQAIRGFRRLAMRYECAKSTAFLGMAMAARNEPLKASRSLLRARRLFIEENNEAWAAFIDLHLSILDLRAGRLRRARLRAQGAVLSFAHREIPSKTILAELVLARIHLTGGAAGEAGLLCRSALRRAEAVGSPGLLFQCRILLGEIQQAGGAMADALQSLETARDALDLLRQGIPEEELRIRFFENKSTLFEHLVSLYLREGSVPQTESAWDCVQNAKSRAFLDVLAHRSSASRQVAPSLRQSTHPIAALRRELQQAYVQATEAELRGNAAQAKLWRQRVSAAELRLKAELAQLRLDAGARLELSSNFEHQPVDLPRVQRALAPGEALVEYFCTTSRVFAFLVNGQGDLIVKDLGATADLRSLTRLALFHISGYHSRRSAGAQPEHQWPALASHLERLHSALIAPIMGHIKAKTLVVAPHGFLHGLPFPALGSTDHPLIKEFSFVGSLSASAFASPYQPNWADIQTHSGFTTSPHSLVLGVPDHRAPLISDEVRQVASCLPGAELHLGEDATLQALRDRGRDARYLHIASHGLFRSDNPMFSAIRLGNGNLNLYELEEMTFSADLVTLSGCSTGVHAVIGGDELIGLSRGFFHAGARNLLVSLWDVSDGSTPEFMRQFYSSLATEVSFETALRFAMLAVRNQFPHPYHWSAFHLLRSAATYRSEEKR